VKSRDEHAIHVVHINTWMDAAIRRWSFFSRPY